jgi:hypothetical protein
MTIAAATERSSRNHRSAYLASTYLTVWTLETYADLEEFFGLMDWWKEISLLVACRALGGCYVHPATSKNGLYNLSTRYLLKDG